MKWILVLVVLVLVLGVAAVIVNVARSAWVGGPFLDPAAGPGAGDAVARRRAACGATAQAGSIREPDRTFTFTADGFEDKHTPATTCPACGGTGLAGPRPDSR